MNSRLKITSRVAALFLMCAVMQVYVFANGTGASISTKDSSAEAERVKTTPNGLLFGRLETKQEHQVALNGSVVTNGTTVLSGSQIQTPAAAPAAVELRSLGRLEIAPDTNLMLTFDKESVSVVVTKGDAFLTTKDGIKGSVITPDGKTKIANSAAANSKGAPGATLPTPAQDPGSSNAFAYAATAFTVIVIVVVVIIIIDDDDENPSRSST